MSNGEEARVSAEVLRGRCISLAESLKENDVWNGAEALVITHGEGQYGSFNRGAALSMHLLGVEVKGGAIVVTQEKVIFVIDKGDEEGLAEAEKISRTTNPKSSVVVTLEKMVKAEGSSPPDEIKSILAEKSKIGAVAKLELWDRWKAIMNADTLVDATAGVAHILWVKDNAAIKRTNWAASMATRVLRQGVVRAIEKALDEDAPVTHEALAEKAEVLCVGDPARVKAKDVPSESRLESCYFPIIQSGGEYDVKPSATSNGNKLSDDVILVSLGARCEGYCATLSRTLFVDPVPKLREAYTALLGAREAALDAMRPGRSLSDAHAAAKKALLKYKLDEYLPKNVGFGLGLDFRDATAILNAKNSKTFESDTVFCLSIAVHDMPLPKSETERAKGAVAALKKLSIQLADTARVRGPNAPAALLTSAPVDWRDISYFINEDDDDDDDDDVDDQDNDAMDIDEPGTTKKRTRGAAQSQAAQQVASSAREREAKQAALMEAALAERRRMQELKASQGGENDDDEDKIVEVRGAYPSTRDYPEDLLANEVCVDVNKEVVFLPINGVPVPIHISWIKTCVQPEADRSAAYLRLNLYAPGQSLGKDVPPSTAAVVDAFGKEQFFVKELLFRSREARRLNIAYRAIQTLRKTYRQRLMAKAQQQDLVQQATLIKARDGRAPRIADLSMRPVASGKKSNGVLEAHANGVRFTTKKQESVDVLYANVHHAIFQPCEKEVLVLIHLHLRNPIIVGKKKTNDVQFYTEVVDASVALDAARRSVYDPDELDEEQRERALRKKLNELFKDFCKRLEKSARANDTPIEFDIPYRDLGFHGVPHREMVLLQPTVHCLVNLTETPFFVLVLDDVEHVHFERCTLRAKNFDAILIKKDHNLPTVAINAIPMAELDAIQDWLTDMNITYTAGPASLTWNTVMQAVRSDTTFYDSTDEDGESKPAGWQFLQAEAEGEDDEEDGADEDDEDYDEDDAEDDADESDDDDDDFDEDESSDDDDDEEEEDDEDAVDWDELEEQAEAEDREKRKGERSEDYGSSRKKSRH